MTVQDPQLFIEAFRAAFTDADFAALLKERDFSIQFVVTGDAHTAFLLDSDGVHDGAPHPAALRLEVKPDTLHLILLGQLGVTQAIVARGLVVKGPISRVRQLADYLPAMGRAYAQLALAPASA
ncbi:SCP2 sterol-binding domain-containing protein [Streptomyces sp. B1I3]|uniref:SCP2 sterol-binding domain-containing protein n=1 Tax=Streptomyces sp. B1I3 TaxID=3042264 RepID=UPI002780420B|nr:SCP2 sterol-binding domain-containing protein [Streptomyces sp. B1I3]MDQ0795260.1 putative sterol carrier protein [Streptomyces sp. B1I3]